VNAAVKAISYYLPPDILSNAELCRIFPELSEPEIFKKTGIRKRHFVNPSEMVASDMAVIAAEQLFNEHNIHRSDIDFILFCSHSFDYKGPATSVLLQDRLSIPNSCGTMDIPLGCSGFTHSLSIAKALINSNQATNVLLITADIPTSVIHPKDSGLRMLFGDAAAATLVGTSEGKECIGNFVYGSDGKGKDNLMVHRSGTRIPSDAEWLNSEEGGNGVLKFGRMEMNPIEVFNFALRIVPSLKDKILQKNNISFDEIDLFVFHQANAFLLSVLRRKMKIPEEKFLMFMEETGNTVSATIPIVLAEAIRSGKAKKGDNVMIAGFGIGYSWSGTVITL
jgi:3-oxoacyl-[acyl-carrier-protein] synthase-3